MLDRRSLFLTTAAAGAAAALPAEASPSPAPSPASAPCCGFAPARPRRAGAWRDRG